MAAFAAYKRHWDEMAVRDETERARLRDDALRTAGEMAGILVKEFGVKKVILFGSLAEGKYFDAGSDIDIAVEGLRKRDYFMALAKLMMASQFEIDLMPLEDVSAALRKRVEKGRLLYEKRKNS